MAERFDFICIDSNIDSNALQLGKHIVPYIGDGIQKETPLSSKKIDKAVQFIIPKKGADYNTYSNNKNRPGRAVPATRYCG